MTPVTVYAVLCFLALAVVALAACVGALSARLGRLERRLGMVSAHEPGAARPGGLSQLWTRETVTALRARVAELEALRMRCLECYSDLPRSIQKLLKKEGG